MSLRLTPNRFPHTTGHAAQQSLNGVISNGSTWSETITLVDANGDQITGVEAHTFQLSLKANRNDAAAELTLTSAASQLTVTVGASTTTLAILATQAVISNLEGDYICDLVSKTGSTLTHRAHGTVTVGNDPVAY